MLTSWRRWSRTHPLGNVNVSLTVADISARTKAWTDPAVHLCSSLALQPTGGVFDTSQTRFWVAHPVKEVNLQASWKQIQRTAESRRQGSELECTAFIFNTKSLHRGAAVLSHVLTENSKTDQRAAARALTDNYREQDDLRSSDNKLI